MLLYAIEAAAISAVLHRHDNDARAAAGEAATAQRPVRALPLAGARLNSGHASQPRPLLPPPDPPSHRPLAPPPAATVKSMPTLPKRMFPARLNSIKAALYRAARAATALPLLGGRRAGTRGAAPFGVAPVTPFATLDTDDAPGMAAALGSALGPLDGGGLSAIEAPGLSRSLQRELEEIEAAARRAPQSVRPQAPLQPRADAAPSPSHLSTHSHSLPPLPPSPAPLAPRPQA